MLASSLIAFQCILFGFLVAGKARGKVFTKEFMKENFK
jgi:hypothetical protein